MGEHSSEVFFMVLGGLFFAAAVTLLLCYQRELNQGYERMYQLSANEYVLGTVKK